MSFLIFGILLVQIFNSSAFIIPDEVPSLLSVIYSNIPVLKKGTDSRLGWGFRLGDRADFQVLVELGPQIYTQKLANQEDTSSNNKRNTLDNLANTLYAQRQEDKKIPPRQQQQKPKVSNTEGGKSIESWSKDMKQTPEAETALPPQAKPGLAIGEIDAKSVIPDDSVLELYKSKRVVTTEKVKEDLV